MKENARIYIISKLSKIVKDISELKILYKFDSFSREHLIKVLPVHEYINNSKYQQIEENLLFDFINKFPNDSLVFFSEGVWINIENPEKVFEGVNYFEHQEFIKLQPNYNINFINNDLFLFSSIDDDFFPIMGFVDDYSEIKLDFDIEQNDIYINSIWMGYEGFNDFKTQCIFSEKTELDSCKNRYSSKNKEKYHEIGYDNYALAA